MNGRGKFGPPRAVAVISLLLSVLILSKDAGASSSDATARGGGGEGVPETPHPSWAIHEDGAPAANCAAAGLIAAGDSVEWCQTMTSFARRHPELLAARDGVCGTQGDCDIPAIRDEAIPQLGSPLINLRIKFNVFREDDGSNPAATQEDIQAQVMHLNNAFLPSRIQFVPETEFVDSSRFRSLPSGAPDWPVDPAEEAAMKTAHADQPDAKLNVYVTGANGMCWAFFPWDLEALGPLGGVVMDAPTCAPDRKILIHEVGHALGLWHTFHGISEEPQGQDPCTWGCYEHAGSHSDTTGDYASDTDPTPPNTACAPPGGVDECTDDTPWGPTHYENYMGYAPDRTCWESFSLYQQARTRCWIADRLSGWVVPGIPTVSGWGVIVMALLVQTVGTVLLRTRCLATKPGTVDR